jgi:hypothetical protein
LACDPDDKTAYHEKNIDAAATGAHPSESRLAAKSFDLGLYVREYNHDSRKTP